MDQCTSKPLSFNNNLKELGVIECKRNTTRKGLVHELPKDNEVGDNEVGTNNPRIRGCDCVNHRILHPVQGLERGRGGGEVRVMTYKRV